MIKASNNEAIAKRIGIVLYPTFDSLDVIGAHQVFHYACKFNPGSELYLIGPSPEDLENPKFDKQDREASCNGLVISGEGVKLAQNISYQDYLNDQEGKYKLDLIYVPGAMDTSTPLYYSQTKQDNPFFQMIDKAQSQAEIIASVCTGALLLGVAGLLAARKVTTHWQTATLLSQFPEVTVVSGYPRYIVDQNIFTGGGISSTIDEALAITTVLFNKKTAEKAQLVMQYHPEPPVNSGDPDHASPEVIYEVSSQPVPYQPGFYSSTSQAFLYYLEHQEIPS